MAPDDPKANDGISNADRLLEIVRAFVTELHPDGKASSAITLDSAIDRELGIDSLGRVELLYRLEQDFGIGLPEQLFANAETPRELLRLVLTATPGSDELQLPEQLPLEPGAAVGVPHGTKTLVEVLKWHTQVQGSRTHVYLYGEEVEPEEICYSDLLQGAERFAAALQELGLMPGRGVAIMLPTCKEYLYTFFAILLAGGIPVPIYPPARLSQIEEHLRRHARILENARTTLLITVPEAKPVARLLRTRVADLKQIITPGELRQYEGAVFNPPPVKQDDIAFLQYTSGSTGNPKGVMLTHNNLLANIRAMGETVRVDSSDVFVSWLPLYHDMGLIGAWLGSLYYACPLVLMSPLAFLTRPHRWLWAIHKHRGTLSAAPNFAYELCLSKIPDSVIKGLDLSSWRMAFNGAEPVSARTIEQFCERFREYGFQRESMSPVYGLAESSVGLAFPPLGRGPHIERLQREALTGSGLAIPALESDPSALELVACGQPLPGHQIRIVDPLGQELPEWREGRLQFQGPSATSGYFRNPEESQKLFDGEWLDSGDLAFLAGGEVFLTSRVKELIIRAGRNIYPYEVEEAIGNLPGIRKGCVAMFGSGDPASGTERLVILAESRESDATVRERLHAEIISLTTDMLGTPPDDVVLAEPHTVLKTSSGKIRRAACKALYAEKKIGNRQPPVWLQFTRLFLAGFFPRLKRAGQTASDLLYAAYVWTLFWILAPVTWLLVVLAPRVSWRWSIMRAATGLFRRLSATPQVVHGLENLPADRNCILVANHASYLDGILLVGVLPLEFRFIAKAELKSSFIPRLFLSRIGAEFVERFDRERGVADAQRLQQITSSGDPFLFFPEGTFRRMPGLLPFRMGAFTTAAEAGIPVVPIAIRGTRTILRADSWLPRHGALSITIGEPLEATEGGWSGALQLRDRSRREILRHLGEPDLGNEL